LTRSWILRTKQLEEINELLASVIIGLHDEQKLLKTLFYLDVRGDVGAAADIRRYPTRFCGFGNLLQQIKGFLAPVLSRKKFCEINDHLGVVGLDFKCLPKRGFIA
jgi:hypothetical protein